MRPNPRGLPTIPQKFSLRVSLRRSRKNPVSNFANANTVRYCTLCEDHQNHGAAAMYPEDRTFQPNRTPSQLPINGSHGRSKVPLQISGNPSYQELGRLPEIPRPEPFARDSGPAARRILHNWN